MDERSWVDRVDDAILNQCSHLSSLRDQPLRMSIADLCQTAVENRDICAEEPSARDDYEVWAIRVDRCNLMLADPDDVGLRRRLAEARKYG